MNLPRQNLLRTLLVLGRVSNVPTVWSNCLAGWLLAGGGDWLRFALLCSGATFVYIGGMYLNDAFDAEFDLQHRRERPIPSGAISVQTVWRLGLGLIAAGLALLCPLGFATTVCSLVLVACVVLYDAVHKVVTFSPLLMAACRFFLYLVAASAGRAGITGVAVWSAFALAGYIVGLSYLARKESTGVVVQSWPLVLLLLPVFLAMLVNDGEYFQPALLISAVLVLWAMRSLRAAWSEPKNIGYAVSGLLAGIVWVDLLAVVNAPQIYGAAFVGLFLLALLFQRFIPAT